MIAAQIWVRRRRILRQAAALGLTGIERGLAKRARTQVDVPRGRLAARDLYAQARRGASQVARLFREVPESSLHDRNRILARSLRRPHRIHHPPPAQRRLIARGEQPRLVARSTFWRRDESGSKRHAGLL
jgi:hypothetical protein